MQDESEKKKIGKYEIIEKIGEGGFGIVYRGKDLMLDRLVAIKVLKSDLTSSTDFIERFRREARLAASLHHTNIATVLDVGEESGRHFLVMDFLSGLPLDQVLKDGKPLSLSQTIELLEPIADALDYAHLKGLVHRDVKPSNIIMNEDGKPVLTDFGLAKSIFDDNNTTTGMVMGTVEYMAPEQILGKNHGPAMDIYAIGVIAYQMLAGQVPFSGKTPFEIQNKHVKEKPRDLRSLNPALSPKISKVIERSLEKKPDQRHKTARDFIEELRVINMSATKEEERRLLKKVKREMRSLEFNDALEKLRERYALSPSDKITALMVECQRKDPIWLKAQSLSRQHTEINRELKQLRKQEKWLPRGLRLRKLLSSPLVIPDDMESEQIPTRRKGLFTFNGIERLVGSTRRISQKVIAKLKRNHG